MNLDIDKDMDKDVEKDIEKYIVIHTKYIAIY